MGLTRRLAICASAALIGVSAIGGAAQAWEPKKPIDFVIMAGPGGGADKMARLMQTIATEGDMTSKPLVPINKAGGSGAEALVHLNTARDPDHTIMVTLNSFFTTPLRQPGLGIDIMQFTPVGRMAEDTFILWVHKDEGISNFDEFIAVAADRGPDWVMGGTGRAQEDEIITDYLNNNYGLSMKYIPYKGGGSVAKDLAGRQITSSVNNPSEALGFYESGDLIPIVAFTEERLPLFPDTPTLKEKGGDFVYGMQRAVVGAPGMSDEAAEYYSNVFAKLYESERWQNYMSTQSLFGEWMTGDEMKAYWQAQRDRHETILKASGAIN